ncbi:MAG: YciI family protein [Gemmatimonadaceae bacterium]|nr:YciI family protein [Gemmatimonadaceae bacterium]
MQVLLLLANAPDAWGSGVATPGDDVIDDWTAYTLALHEAGVLVYGAGLEAPNRATTVRHRHGKRVLTDGPFTETKEHLIGFYVLDVPTLDDAHRWAARVPNVRSGSVEVRPLSPGQTTTETLAAHRAVRSAPMP